MNNVLDHSLPFEKYFEEICHIPHGSFNEQQLSDRLVSFAKNLGLGYKQYENGCVIIYKEGSPGYEDHDPVMLQGHMDMVCQKVPGCTHDFKKDPLDLYVEDGLIRARGTTLGADDGVGVAYMMAILASDACRHPFLECVFTVQEEVGCVGVNALRAGDLRSKRMIGLDDISGGATTICSAGSGIMEQVFEAELQRSGANLWELTVDGLLGGHSGDQIHLERASAIKVAVRVLYDLALQGVPIQISAFHSGSVTNSIPRDCKVQFAAPLSTEQLAGKSAAIIAGIREEYTYSDPDLRVTFTEAASAPVYSTDDSARLLEYLYLLPDGFQHRSLHLDGLTTASTNLGILHTENGRTRAVTMCRGASDSFIDTQMNQFRLLNRLYGWTELRADRAPCWKYKENSPLREIVSQVFSEVTGRELLQVAEHGGLECGGISKMRPEMDIVTLGPKVRGYHTSDEYLDRRSFAEIYKVLTAVLERL
jgi:dipeptidase D